MKILRFRGETLTLAASVTFATTRGIPPGMNLLEIEVPSATLENIAVALTPKITKAWFYDDSATTKYVDLTSALTDRNTSTGTGTNLNSMTTADFLYFGCPQRFRGLAVDVTNTNTNTATALVTYWNGSAWTNITPTDGTDPAGGAVETLGQDGLITWTVPTDWATTTVNSEPTALFWVRYAVDAALDATVSIVGVSTLLNATVNSANSDAEGQETINVQSNNRTLPPYRLYFDPSRFGGLEMVSASITSACNLNWYQCAGGY